MNDTEIKQQVIENLELMLEKAKTGGGGKIYRSPACRWKSHYSRDRGLVGRYCLIIVFFG